jgi:alpha-ketoglutarate-dependent taurine dioxygenase
VKNRFQSLPFKCNLQRYTAAQIKEKPEQTWPVVRVHPVTGAKSIYVNPKNTSAVVDRRTGLAVGSVQLECGCDP